MATSTHSNDDLFRQAICAWESAVASGVKMQEESAKTLREMFSNSSSLSEWYNKGQAVAGETIAKTQENIDEAIRVINQQAESSVRLIQKALEARQSEPGADARMRFAEWWEAAMDAMQANSQALLKANSRILSTWSELARKINGDTVDAMSHLADKTAEQAEKMTQSASERVKEMVKQAAGK
jgi:hypothetical protein